MTTAQFSTVWKPSLKPKDYLLRKACSSNKPKQLKLSLKNDIIYLIDCYFDFILCVNSIIIQSMKSKRLSAKKTEHKILGGEAEKLKDKLEGLKEQIKLKKQQKQMNKTSNSISSTKPNTRPSSQLKLNATQSSFTRKPSLHEILTQLKIENIQNRLKEKNIGTVEQFQSIQVSQIDEWKDIPVGYRIKIRKYVQNNHAKEVKKEEKNENSQQIQPEKKEEEIPDIESIIKNRKQLNKFVAIERAKDVESQDQHIQNIEEEEQQKMMLSIMQVFRGRASSIKDKSKRKQKCVHWSPQVQEMEKHQSNVKTYPKQTISKSLFDLRNDPIQHIEIEGYEEKKPASFKPKVNTFVDNQEYPDYKYCWTCLKKIESNIIDQHAKSFCSKKCNSVYKQAVDQNLLEEADHFEEPINNEPIPLPDEEEYELDFDIV